MREATQSLHRRAERSGIVCELLAGRATRHGYALLLRNLQPAYAALESGLDLHRLTPGLGHLARPAVYRSAALAADLGALADADRLRDLPLLAAAKRYALRIEDAARGDGARLIAHAYVRYLGDLNGGRILRRLVGGSLGLTSAMLGFYDYGAPDTAALESDYRSAIDAAGDSLESTAAVVAEAVEGFLLNIELSEAVLNAAGPAL